MLTTAFGLLRIVPAWAWILAAALAWGGWQHHTATRNATRAAEATAAAAQQAATRRAEQAAREQEQRNAEAVQNVAAAYGQRLAQTRADAAGARAGLDQLRSAIAAAPASCAATDAAAAGGAAAARITGELFGRCAATLQGVAEQADRLEAKLTALQAYERERLRIEAATR